MADWWASDGRVAHATVRERGGRKMAADTWAVAPRVNGCSGLAGRSHGSGLLRRKIGFGFWF
jgi:hypothetical protein